MVNMYNVSVIQVAEGMAFVRVDDAKVFPDSGEPPLAEDSTSGPECPDLELLVSPLGFNLAAAGPMTEPRFGVHAISLRPTSLGTIRLKSNDPFDSPVIDPRFVDDTACCLTEVLILGRQVSDHTTRCASVGQGCQGTPPDTPS